MRVVKLHKGKVKLYCGDCRKVLPKLTDIDAVITDPPYGISHPCNYKAKGRSKKAICKNYSAVEGDNKPFNPTSLLSLGAPLVLFGANYYANKLPNQGGWLVWDKKRPDDLDQATCELAWSNCVKGVRIFHFLWHGMLREGPRIELQHPTQKPIELMRWCMSLRWTKDFKSIFDPYMGVGTTGVAAVELGKKFVGVEIKPEYFDIAIERIRNTEWACELNKRKQNMKEIWNMLK